MPDPDPGKASHSLAVVFALLGGTVLVAMLIVLVMVLGELRSTDEHVAGTDAKLERIISASKPVAEDAPPLIDVATTALEEFLPAVRDASDLLAPLADKGTDASAFLDRLPLFQQGIMSFFEEAVLAVRLTTDFLTAAISQDLVGKAVDSHRLLESLLAVQLETLEKQRKSLRTQRQSLHVQVRTTRKIRKSLEIQRKTLDHVRSIDRKTGGELPPP